MDGKQKKEWLDSANSKKYEYGEPVWSFDCGSKLDFDGPAVRISSRFYNLGNDLYDGSVSVLVGDEVLFCREFSTRHIDAMRDEVEKYTAAITANLRHSLKYNLSLFVPELGKREVE